MYSFRYDVAMDALLFCPEWGGASTTAAFGAQAQGGKLNFLRRILQQQPDNAEFRGLETQLVATFRTAQENLETVRQGLQGTPLEQLVDMPAGEWEQALAAMYPDDATAESIQIALKGVRVSGRQLPETIEKLRDVLKYIGDPDEKLDRHTELMELLVTLGGNVNARDEKGLTLLVSLLS